MAMTVRQRKAALVENGIVQAEIARELGVSAAYVCDVIKGQRPAPHIRAKIAEKLGLTVDEVFGAAEAA